MNQALYKILCDYGIPAETAEMLADNPVRIHTAPNVQPILLNDDLMTVEFAAFQLKVSEGRVRQLISSGELETVNIDERTRLITAESVCAYADKRKPAGRPREMKITEALQEHLVNMLNSELGFEVELDETEFVETRDTMLDLFHFEPKSEEWSEVLQRAGLTLAVAAIDMGDWRAVGTYDLSL